MLLFFDLLILDYYLERHISFHLSFRRSSEPVPVRQMLKRLRKLIPIKDDAFLYMIFYSAKDSWTQYLVMLLDRWIKEKIDRKLKLERILLNNFKSTIHCSGGTQMKTNQRMLSAFPTVTVVNSVYTIKAHPLIWNFHGLTHIQIIGVSQWRWPDGLPNPDAGGIANTKNQ